MDSLESVSNLLVDHLKEALQCGTETEKLLLIINNKDFPQRVYNAFFNLIADHTQSPESIILILETYTSGLDGFSTNNVIQALIAFACFEALAKRRPKALNGPWETLVWVIVKYSSFPNTELGNSLTHITETNIEILKFIIEFGSPELCPNPCLRLELFRLIRIFNCNDMCYDRKSFRDKIINTLLELCDKNTSLTIDQVPNVNPIDLHYVMEDNYIDIVYIMNNYDYQLKKSELITAILKLTKNFALLVKEKQHRLNHQAIGYGVWYVSIKEQLSACLSFCGLLPFTKDDDYDECLVYMVQAVGNDSILQNCVIDTLDTITQVSLSFPDDDDLQKEVIHIKDIFFKGYINQLPKFQCLQEMFGGLSPAEEYRLRYFQNNTMDQNKDSDNESECYASNENDHRQNIYEEDIPVISNNI